MKKLTTEDMKLVKGGSADCQVNFMVCEQNASIPDANGNSPCMIAYLYCLYGGNWF